MRLLRRQPKTNVLSFVTNRTEVHRLLQSRREGQHPLHEHLLREGPSRHIEAGEWRPLRLRMEPSESLSFCPPAWHRRTLRLEWRRGLVEASVYSTYMVQYVSKNGHTR